LLYSICTYTHKTVILEHNKNKTWEGRGAERSRGRQRGGQKSEGEVRKGVMEQRQEELRKIFITKTEHM